jgi:hypothetical protein
MTRIPRIEVEIDPALKISRAERSGREYIPPERCQISRRRRPQKSGAIKTPKGLSYSWEVDDIGHGRTVVIELML